jgi:hypothetical protein
VINQQKQNSLKETYQCDIRKKTMPGKIDVAEKEKLDLSEKLVK